MKWAMSQEREWGVVVVQRPITASTERDYEIAAAIQRRLFIQRESYCGEYGDSSSSSPPFECD